MQVRKIVTTITTSMMLLLISSSAFAQQVMDEATAAAEGEHGMKALAAAIAIGLAALGGAVGQGKAASAALEGIARNPNASGKIFTPLILGLALIESLVIYALVIALMIAP